MLRLPLRERKLLLSKRPRKDEERMNRHDPQQIKMVSIIRTGSNMGNQTVKSDFLAKQKPFVGWLICSFVRLFVCLFIHWPIL